MPDAVLGFNEWTLTSASWVFYFLALLAFTSLLVAQAIAVSHLRALAREAGGLGGVAPVGAVSLPPAFSTGTLSVTGQPSGAPVGAGRADTRVPLGRAARLCGRVAVGLTLAGVISLGSALVLRANTSGHIPYMSLYEVCLMFTLGIALVYLVIGELWLKMRLAGAFTLLLVYLVESYALLLIPPDLKMAKSLIPPLQSIWLPIHVSMAIIAYSCFALAASAALMYLLHYYQPGAWTRALPSLATIDEFMFRAVAVGFPFQTLLLITGAYWAQTAWSKAWSWDPKEVWALITWLAYAAFLHVRVQRGWRGTTAAWLALAGFALVLITFIGVNYLVSWLALTSLHAYGGDMPGILSFSIFGLILVLLLGSIGWGEVRRHRLAARRARYVARAGATRGRVSPP